MKMMEIDTIPCWYQLSFDASVPAILLKAHNDFVKSVQPIPHSAPIVIEFTKKFGFFSFSGNLNTGFGFNNTLFWHTIERIRQEGDFAVFSLEIPEIEVLSEKICDGCDGSGKNQWEEKCLNCQGRGRETKINWEIAFSISASFALFFELTFLYKEESSCLFPQLMTVKTQVSNDHASIDGAYSVPLARYLSDLGVNTKIEEMTKAMKIVHRRMYPFDEFYSVHDFYATVDSENGWLNIGCPGDRCGLYPIDVRAGEGYRFSCHNVDNPMQQITLLAGLAALHDKAKKEIRF